MSMPAEVQFRSAELVYRQEPDGTGGVLEGRMVPYSQWTEIRSAIEGHFLERVMPGALTKTLSERASKIRILFEHGFSKLLDAQPIASLEDVRDEADGPYYRAALLDGLPDLFMSGLRAGLYGTSIAMRPLKGEVVKRPKRSDHNPEGIEERSITEAFLREFSVVTFPAYEGATATVRSLTDDLYAWKLMQDPAALLSIVRAQATEEEEPSHSGPAEEENESESEEESRDTQPEQEDPERKQPVKDWLAPTEEQTKWLSP